MMPIEKMAVKSTQTASAIIREKPLRAKKTTRTGMSTYAGENRERKMLA
jgi:hypothetical protein